MKKILFAILFFTFFSAISQEKESTLMNIFSFVNAYDYQKNDELLNNNPEQIVLANEGLKLITRLEIREENNAYCFIKTTNTPTNSTVIYSFLLENNQWKTLNQDTDFTKNIKSILEVLNADLLFDFANNNSSYHKEIEKIKKLAKDDNGVLDILKLSKVVQENKVVLQKLYK